MIEAVIFDMDGTLLDTERLGVTMWHRAGQQYGYELTKDIVTKFHGVPRETSRAFTKDMFGDTFPFDELRALRMSYAEEYYETYGIPVKPYALELLTFLKDANIKIALATSTHYEIAKNHLEKCGLLSFFDVIIGGDMVEKGKPNPDIFLKAATELHVAPEHAFIVEDSLAGVQAGYDAGCKVIMVPDQTAPTPDTTKLLFRCCDSLKDIIALLS